MGKRENSGYLRNYCNQWPENLKVQTTNSVNESIKGHCQGHFLTLFYSGLCLYEAQISGLQEHWSSGLNFALKHRLRALVRTSSLRWFQQSVLEQN